MKGRVKNGRKLCAVFGIGSVILSMCIVPRNLRRCFLSSRNIELNRRYPTVYILLQINLLVVTSRSYDVSKGR
jgi:hypothetical protein